MLHVLILWWTRNNGLLVCLNLDKGWTALTLNISYLHPFFPLAVTQFLETLLGGKKLFTICLLRLFLQCVPQMRRLTVLTTLGTDHSKVHGDSQGQIKCSLLSQLQCLLPFSMSTWISHCSLRSPCSWLSRRTLGNGCAQDGFLVLDPASSLAFCWVSRASLDRLVFNVLHYLLLRRYY